jgi:hypothetical protein
VTSRRRAVALAVLLPLLEPAAVGVSVFTAARPHECTDHYCLCTARGRPPKRTAPSCHAESAREATMSGSCHRGDAPKVGAITPYVLPAPVQADRAAYEAPAPALFREDPRPGFSRIDSPPPKSV